LFSQRIKSSKIKVMWQLAFENEFAVHQVELKHSVVSGKREIQVDNRVVFSNKTVFKGMFEHVSNVQNHELRITVGDTFEGFVYDLLVDGTPFHRLPRKSLADLESLRRTTSPTSAEQNKATVSTDFASFTGKSSALLDRAGAGGTCVCVFYVVSCF
jgi:hypothetical protein